jgi:hypothetical protein
MVMLKLVTKEGTLLVGPFDSAQEATNWVVDAAGKARNRVNDELALCE